MDHPFNSILSRKDVFQLDLSFPNLTLSTFDWGLDPSFACRSHLSLIIQHSLSINHCLLLFLHLPFISSFPLLGFHLHYLRERKDIDLLPKICPVNILNFVNVISIWAPKLFQNVFFQRL